MKKLLYLLSLLVFIISCKSYNDFMSIENHYTIEKKDNLIDGKYLNVEVNGNSIKMLFDTGATTNTISDINAIGGKEIFTKDNYTNIVTIKAADGEPQSVGKYKTDSIVINIAKSKNLKAIIENVKLNIDCIKNQSIVQGIYGLENFKESSEKLVLDYQNNIIEFTNANITTDYKEVSAEFSRKQIHVNITIEDKTHKLIFDTGNSSGILLIKNVLKGEQIISKYDVLAKLANDKLVTFQNKTGKVKKMTSGNIVLKNIPITESKGIKESNMGLAFINKFNWIIDFQNEKLYAKRILNKPFNYDDDSISTSEFLVAPINGELVVAFKKSVNQNISVGDIITEVNGEEVNSQNICNIFERLNTSKNWSDLDIITQSKEN